MTNCWIVNSSSMLLGVLDQENTRHLSRLSQPVITQFLSHISRASLRIKKSGWIGWWNPNPLPQPTSWRTPLAQVGQRSLVKYALKRGILLSPAITANNEHAYPFPPKSKTPLLVTTYPWHWPIPSGTEIPTRLSMLHPIFLIFILQIPHLDRKILFAQMGRNFLFYQLVFRLLVDYRLFSWMTFYLHLESKVTCYLLQNFAKVIMFLLRLSSLRAILFPHWELSILTLCLSILTMKGSNTLKYLSQYLNGKDLCATTRSASGHSSWGATTKNGHVFRHQVGA